MKNQFIQSIRGVCIICVVLIHSLMQDSYTVYNNEINIVIRTTINFAVGIFIFLAGYFIKINEVKKDTLQFYKRKLKRILIPYFIWSVMYIVIFHMDYIKYFNVKELISAFILGKSAAHLYYIVALIQLIIVTPILVKILDMNNKGINILMIAITFVYTFINSISNYYMKTNIPLYATLFFAWISFYYIGMLIKKQNIRCNNIRISSILCVTILILFLNIFINIFAYKNGLNYSYCTSQIKFINSIYIMLVIILVSDMIYKLSGKKFQSNVLSKIGDKSFGIYLVHLIFVGVFKKVIGNIECIAIIKALLIAVLSLCASIFFIKVFNILTKNKLVQYVGF